jgi:hypothetical protein
MNVIPIKLRYKKRENSRMVNKIEFVTKTFIPKQKIEETYKSKQNDNVKTTEVKLNDNKLFDNNAYYVKITSK